MSKLPRAENALVPERKITHYLLDLTSEKGQDKARFFLAFGFRLESWQLMAEDLKQHAIHHPIANIRPTPFGIHYVIEGELLTPDERNPQVRSVWKIETGETLPALVTAYPLE